MTCIFYIFIYIFVCEKSFFSVKTFFIIKLFFHIKTFFFANNVYFVKKQIFFQKKIIFFNLVLQQMNNHSRPTVFCKKGVLTNFAKFTGEHKYQSLFFNKVAGLRPAALLKKRFWHRCFPMNFVKRTPFF